MQRVLSVPADLEPVLPDDLQPQQFRIEASKLARRSLDLAGALVPPALWAGDDDVADLGVHRTPLLCRPGPRGRRCAASQARLAEYRDRMGDTSRGVLWAIERRCALRRRRDWQLPHVTHRQLCDLRQINGIVFEGVCITGHTYLGTRPDLPTHGFVVERMTARFGGEDRVRTTCGACEANVGDGGLVGCHGYLRVNPDSLELDE